MTVDLCLVATIRAFRMIPNVSPISGTAIQICGSGCSRPQNGFRICGNDFRIPGTASPDMPMWLLKISKRFCDIAKSFPDMWKRSPHVAPRCFKALKAFPDLNKSVRDIRKRLCQAMAVSDD
jgi:hypothetical protein